MSLYTLFMSGIVFPIHEKLKRHTTVGWRKKLEKSQWLPSVDIQALQLENLKRFLIKIGRDVPYYSEVFQKAGFDPSAMTSVAELSQLPFLDKSLIRANTHKLKSIHAGQLAKFNTGGSSGQPLIFYLGNERVSHDVAAKWRATRWWSVDIGDPELVLWGSPIELGAQDKLRLLRDKLFRSQLLSAFDLTPARLDEFLEVIRTVKPKMLFGYPSVISMLAKHAQEQGVDVASAGIRVIFCTSERLYDHQRALMERVFAAPVANGYGGRDAGFIAHQCPDGGMHLMAEDIVVEVVDNDGNPLPPGQSGEIVVTHTATSEFPFVRYRTGDVGVLSDRQCDCGRGLPLLEEIVGRTTDFVMAQDGTLLHGLSLIYVLREVEGVEEFKIIQHDRDRVEVQIRPNGQWSSTSETAITEKFQQRLGATVAINFTMIDVLAAEASGKYRYVISHAV